MQIHLLKGVSSVQINLPRVKLVSKWSSDLERGLESPVVDKFPLRSQQQMEVYSMFL